MVLIYEKTITAEPTDNGLGGLVPSSCLVTEDVNGQLELAMKHPMDDDGKWLKIQKWRVLWVPTHRGNQLFRIYDINTDIIPGTVLVSARHIFYDLLWNFIESARPVDDTGAQAGTAILAGCQYASGFTFASDITATNTAYYVRMNPVQALIGDVGNSFINRWGGELLRDNYDIAINTRIGADNGAKIRYRKNLSGLKITENTRDVITRIYPICTGAGNTIYVLPEKYIDSSHVADYPAPIIGYVRYTDIQAGSEAYPTSTEIYAELRTRVAALYADGIDLPKMTLDVQMIPLEKTEEYSAFASAAMALGDDVTVEYEPASIDLKLRVVSLTYDSLLGRIVALKIGDSTVTLSNHVASIDQEITNLKNMTSSQWFDDYSKNIIPCYDSQVQAAADSYNVAIIQEGSILKGDMDGKWNVGIGPWVEITGDNNVAIGDGTEATGYDSVAIGDAAAVAGNESIAIGYNPYADGDGAIAIGRSSQANGDNSIAVGRGSTVYGTANIAIGDSSGSTNTGINNIFMGTAATGGSGVDEAVIIGHEAQAVSGNDHVVIGKAAMASGADDDITIGTDAVSYGRSGIAIGDGAIAGDSTALNKSGMIAIGNQSQARGGNYNIALGDSAETEAGEYNTVIGHSGHAIGDGNLIACVAGGYADGFANIVIGDGYADGQYNIVIGTGTTGPTTINKRIVIGHRQYINIGGVDYEVQSLINGGSDDGITLLVANAAKTPLRVKIVPDQTANAFTVFDYADNIIGGFSASGGVISVTNEADGTAVKVSISDLATIPAEASRALGTKYLVEPTDAELLAYRTMLADHDADIWGRM